MRSGAGVGCPGYGYVESDRLVTENSAILSSWAGAVRLRPESDQGALVCPV